MATVTIKELYDILSVDNIGDYGINAKDIDGVNQIVITSENTIQYMMRKYGTRRYSILKGKEVNNIDAEIDFNECFKLWLVNRQHNIDKQYQSLFNYDYSPIENVDRYETEKTITKDTTNYGKTTSHSGTDTEVHDGTDKTTYTNTTTNGGTDEDIKTGTDTNNHSINDDVSITQKAGFNAPNTFTNSEKTSHDLGNERNTTSYDTIETTIHDSKQDDNSSTDITHGEKITNEYGEKITNAGSDTTNGDVDRELRVHGNIGVTTNTQLINDEIELRLISLAEMLIDNFVNDYTFYS